MFHFRTLALLALLLILPAASGAQQRAKLKKQRPTEQQQERPRQRVVQLSPSALTVGARQYRYYRFYVPVTTRIGGRFRATGGSGNDINVMILDADGFENFQNGHSVGTYYNSGYVTVGNINVDLGRGVYFLIFANRASLVTSKAVETIIGMLVDDGVE